MRCEITQQQYVDFLNTLPYALQAAHTAVKPEAAAGASAMGEYRNGIRIVTPGVPGSIEPVVIDRGSFVAMGTRSKPGTPATYETTLPFVACNAIHSVDAAAFAAWAGLRPMTELEFEKACRGPLRPVPDEYAWGTDKIAMDGAYTLVSDGQPDETVTWSGNDGPDAVHGNAVTRHTMGEIKGPLRAGIFATPDSDRVRAGASYWGILDLSGNLLERTITVGNTAGRACGGRHGAGDAGSAPWPETALGMRGGWSLDFRHRGFWDDDKMLRISNRHSAAQWDLHKRKPRFLGLGFRCARTAPGR
jgi:formylglycine-generating enzyme required for sulfatase activity